jgi:hypothetical protein
MRKRVKFQLEGTVWESSCRSAIDAADVADCSLVETKLRTLLKEAKHKIENLNSKPGKKSSVIEVKMQ